MNVWFGGAYITERSEMLTRALSSVRTAIHRVMRARGYDPVARDPWYFPSMEDYVKVFSFQVMRQLCCTGIHLSSCLYHLALYDTYVIDAPDHATCFWLVTIGWIIRSQLIFQKHS